MNLSYSPTAEINPESKRERFSSGSQQPEEPEVSAGAAEGSGSAGEGEEGSTVGKTTAGEAGSLLASGP